MIAICSASIVNSCGIVSRIAQPTTRRENMSSATAKWSQPSRVEMYVMSASHTSFGEAAVNCRSRRLAALGWEWWLSVVRGARHIAVTMNISPLVLTNIGTPSGV